MEGEGGEEVLGNNLFDTNFLNLGKISEDGAVWAEQEVVREHYN